MRPRPSLMPPRSDVLLAAAVTVLAQIETWTSGGYEPKLAYSAAALVMTVPVAWRRMAPLVVLALVFAPLVAMVIAGHPLDSMYVMVALLLAFHAVGTYCERRRSAVAAATALCVLGLTVAIEGKSLGDLLFVAVILAGVWALAAAVRERQARADHLEGKAREAVADERARIARELHDVVAHSISVIAVQTGSVRRRLRHERPQDAADLEEVERVAREALAEMRRLLGLLRTDDERRSLTPQPGIDQVDRLAEQMRRTGLPVEVEIEGEPRPLPPGIDLAAYRIVQEALTNTLKHAGLARARVALRYGARDVELEVSDDGSGAERPRNGAGHGLVGMRERVALYGGSFDVESGPGRGFRIRARLPTSTA